ncbi:fibronectin type-III domain-containing protein [Trichonephila clavipes]|nr:fibronectin type-III domain-containing protein [Trichonephila clavipes]
MLIRAKGPPDPVRNCIVVNQSHSWLQVECEPGYSNGLQQKFHLDVYNSAVDHLQVNKSSSVAPKFSVQDLPAGTPFVLVIYASNEKGKSNSLAIVAHTSQNPLTDAGQRCTFNLSRAETPLRWCGMVVRSEEFQLKCRPRHLTMVRNYVVRRHKPSCS